MYYCFGCGAGGNVFTFLMEYENFTFVEALKFLADRAGVELPQMEYSKEAKEQADLKNTLLEINKQAAKFYYYQLHTERGKQGYDYLKGAAFRMIRFENSALAIQISMEACCTVS